MTPDLCDTLPVEMMTTHRENNTMKMRYQAIPMAFIFALAGSRVAIGDDLAAPQSHPVDAVHQHVIRYSDEYDAYFWWENENIWIEVYPVSSGPFICGGLYHVIQDGTQYSVSTRTASGNSFCDNLYVPTKFKFSPHDIGKFDQSIESSIIIETASDPYIVTLPPASNPAPTSTPAPTATPAPVQCPTPAPVQCPTPAPVQCPTPAPVPTPVPCPVATPTPAPTPAPVYDKPQVGTYDLNVQKVTCQRKNKKKPATQLPGDGGYLCDGLPIQSGDKVTITIVGTKK